MKRAEILQEVDFSESRLDNLLGKMASRGDLDRDEDTSGLYVLPENPDQSRELESDTHGTHNNKSLVKQYPTSDSNTPTVTIDTRLINADGDVPDRSEATAHYVQTYMMGVWMKDGWVLARNTDQIEGAGRFVVVWAGGQEKQVIEAMRYDDKSVMVTYHHEARRERFWEVESDGGETIFEREDGSQITVQVLGRVIMPRPHGQQQSEKIQRSVERALESLQLNGGG